MIDTDKELEWVTTWDKEDRHIGVISNHECVVDVDWVEELLTEVKRLRKQLEDCKRQIQFTADWIRDRGEATHAKELDEFLGWME